MTRPYGAFGVGTLGDDTPRVVVHPGRAWGGPTIGDSRLAVDVVCEMFAHHGLAELMDDFDLTPADIHVCVWWAAIHASDEWWRTTFTPPRKRVELRRAWREWAAVEELNLRASDRHDRVVGPPTVANIACLRTTNGEGHMDDNLCFVDVETTGLDVRIHHLWEIGIVNADNQFSWQVRPDLTYATPRALEVGRYYERFNHDDQVHRGGRMQLAKELSRLLAGKTLVGVNVSFDAQFLAKFLDGYRHCAPWHYRLVNIRDLIVGCYGLDHLDDSTDTLSRLVGVDPDDYARHTAVGDALWTRAMYDAVASV